MKGGKKYITGKINFLRMKVTLFHQPLMQHRETQSSNIMQKKSYFVISSEKQGKQEQIQTQINFKKFISTYLDTRKG